MSITSYIRIISSRCFEIPRSLLRGCSFSPLTSEGMILQYFVRISQHEFNHHRALWSSIPDASETPEALVERPGALERHFVQEAQCAGRDAHTTGREPSGLRQIELVGSNFFRPQIFWRTTKVFCIRDDLLDIGRLRISCQIADRHVFEHPLA